MKRLLRVVCLCVLVLVLLPTAALARDYTVTSVDISAQIAADGSLAVIESRTYDFDGEFNGMYWDIPCGSYLGREIKAELEGVFAGDSTALPEIGSDEKSEGYQIAEDGDDHLRLVIYRHAKDETLTFTVAYKLPNLVTRWADVGELYWQYVPKDEGSGKEWQNVTCRVALPAPEGETVVPGENVRAWGHGPLDGSVSFENKSVVFFSPGVGSSEYLEARITFPAEWLTQVAKGSEAQLDTILEEEAQWAAEANARRRNARIAYWGIPIAMIVLAAVSALVGYLYTHGKLFRSPKPTFKEKYYRDVPTDDHPAVLGMLYSRGELSGTELTATFMNLADQGKLTLDTVEVEKLGKFNRVQKEQEWRMTRVHVPVAKSAYAFAQTEKSKEIDSAAMAFLFRTVAGNKSLDDSLRGYMGEPYVLSSFFTDVAHKEAKGYEEGYNEWAKAVKKAFNAHNFSKYVSTSDIFPGILGLADFVLMVVLGIAGMLFASELTLTMIGVIALVAAGIYCIMINGEGPVLVFNQEAVDLRAKLVALRRWLCDFTRLGEAIPTDVVLWNRLLIMATVLGVADKVVKQLKVCAPELLENTEFVTSEWCVAQDKINPATKLVAAAVGAGAVSVSSKLHSYSSSSLSSSSDSSYRGGGGGFSSGGGGGFSGGGGRGGAF